MNRCSPALKKGANKSRHFLAAALEAHVTGRPNAQPKVVHDLPQDQRFATAVDDMAWVAAQMTKRGWLIPPPLSQC